MSRLRSTEAPMDFQFTSRPSSNTPPVWAAAAASSDDPTTPKKRPHDALAPAHPPFPGAPTPTFGAPRGSPFLFTTPAPAPHTPPAPAWAPPPLFSPEKAFPQPQFSELRDVDMAEASPPREGEGARAVAGGALRRVFRSRERERARGSRLAMTRVADAEEDEDEGSGEESDEEEDGGRGRVARRQNTSNHYTLNLPSAPAPQSDTPYILLGYLQFFFNLSLVLVFLYLVLQFILTVQRDVEQRISEYSMDIVQEIAMCATQHKNNLCASPIPAMAHQCASWETCMNRDPTIVGRARVGAEMIAEVVNGFVEPISWKTLAFTLTSLSFLTVFINTLLSLYRARIHHPAPAPVHPPPVFALPPSTPFPREHFGGYLSPAPTPAWGRRVRERDDVLETPTRRRRLEGGAAGKAL
ncbi:hypothetical protein HWV62_38590 [Athelia sp. TMB]|nr:hypothetical protein HWV62_38590 [Athelia sp. TMB]